MIKIYKKVWRIIAIGITPFILAHSAFATSIPNAAKNISPLKEGARIPSVSFQTIDGATVALRDLLKQPTVLVFYRGGWCPYCNIQLSSLKEVESKLESMGFAVVAVSPDRPQFLKESSDKYNLSYTLLSDSSMDASKAFGIAFRVDDVTIEKYKGFNIDLEAASGKEHHLLPVPSVFIIDTQGIIRFTHSNADYKVRLSPKEFLAAAKAVNRSNTQIHSHFTKVLKQYVAAGRVDYAGLKKDRSLLDTYLKSLANVSRDEFDTWSKNARLAYLINLYNATTLQLIIDHHPVSSIRKIRSFMKGPWDQPVVSFFGKKITLNNLEHTIIRKDYKEPRIHMALVCAAKGCPPLRCEAFVADHLDEQLTDQCRIYLSRREGMQIFREEKSVYLSRIFKWYRDDFSFVKAFAQQYSGKSLDGLEVKWLDYDWSLNTQK